MPNVCCVVGCKSNSKKTNHSFHCFPKGAELRATWLLNLGLSPKFAVTRSIKVCSTHFAKEAFSCDPELVSMEKRRLRLGAVPENKDKPLQVTASTHSPDKTVYKKPTFVDAAVQMNPNLKDNWAQYDRIPFTSRDAATQTISCNITPINIEDDALELGEPILPSTPLKRKRTRELSESDMEQDSIIKALEVSMAESNSHDLSYQQDSASDDSFTVPINDNRDMENTTSFLVFETCLLMLFKFCYACLTSEPPCVAKCKKFVKTVQGTCLSIITTCHHGHVNEWMSQPQCNGTPLGNIRLAAGLFFTGSEIAKSLRMLGAVGMQCFSSSCYYAIQRSYLLYATQQVWNRQQQQLIAARQNRPVALGGDGRCDSMGHCAKYLTYFAMDMDSQKVLDVQLVQSTEVESSVHMEKEALKRSLNFLIAENISISHLVTDRHTQIRKFMTVEHPSIIHMFDMWHFAKGIRKKLLAAAKTKAFCRIADWIDSVINHLYWSVMSSGGNGELAAEKWNSVTRHIVNMHDGHGELYDKCPHDKIDKNWIPKDGAAHQKLLSILNSRVVLKDVKHLSHAWETANLECAQKIVIHFAPKHTHYSYLGMRARCLLAALHINENGSKAHAKTRRDLRYVTLTKKRPGRPSVHAIKEHSTFNYVLQLMQETVALCREYTYNEAPTLNVQIPPPLCSRYPQVSKLDAIQPHVSRFAVERDCDILSDEFQPLEYNTSDDWSDNESDCHNDSDGDVDSDTQ